MTPTAHQPRQTQRTCIAVRQALQRIFENQWHLRQARRHENKHKHTIRIATMPDCKHGLHWSPSIMKQCAISRSLNGASQRHRRRQWLILRMTDRSCVDSSKSSEIVFFLSYYPNPPSALVRDAISFTCCLNELPRGEQKQGTDTLIKTAVKAIMRADTMVQ